MELYHLNGESEISEFKVNNSRPQTLGDNLVALANSAALNEVDYAYLIFGVNDRGQVVGTQFDHRKPHKGQDLKIWLSTQIRPAVHFTVQTLMVDGKKVVVFTIHPATKQPARFKGKESIRVGASTRDLSQYPDKEAILWQKLGGRQFETSLTGQRSNLDDILQILDTQAFYKRKDMTPIVSNRTAVADNLVASQLIRRDRGQYAVTSLGALLLAKDLSQFAGLERKLPRLIVYKGKNRVQSATERNYQSGLVTSLPELLHDISQILPKKEVFNQAVREELTIYPEQALRELVINAIIHQDLSVTGSGPLIDVFEGRVEISNPGSPLISTKKFIGFPPRSRNERLAKEMRLLNFCEERGTGVAKAMALCEVYQLPAPQFRSDENYTITTVFGPKDFSELNRTDRPWMAYMHAVLKSVSQETMTNQSLRKCFGLKQAEYPRVSKVIKEAIAEGLIKPADPQRTTGRYVQYIPYWA